MAGAPEIVYGLGTFASELTSSFDIELPENLINQLNNKIGVTEDAFIFNLEDASGVFGAENGSMSWNNGQSTYSYITEVSEDGLSGSNKNFFNSEVNEFFKDLLGIVHWDHMDEENEYFWDIDVVNMKAEFGFKGKQTVLSDQNNQGNFGYNAFVEFQVEATDDSFELTINPSYKQTGFDEASEEFLDGVWVPSDVDYKSTIVLSVPELDNCESYFTTLSAKSECVVNFESSDLDSNLILKMKPKFAFVKFDNHMYYVKSENFAGTMVSFAEVPYLSFYYTENANKQPFITIRRKYNKVGEDLLLTIPVVAVVKDVTDAVMEVGKKWMDWGFYAFENPVKSLYWMDVMVASVQPSTFDFSNVVASTRIGCGEYSNEQIQQDAKDFSSELYLEFKNADFSWLDSFREYVEEVQAAKNEVAQKFALPN